MFNSLFSVWVIKSVLGFEKESFHEPAALTLCLKLVDWEWRLWSRGAESNSSAQLEFPFCFTELYMLGSVWECKRKGGAQKSIVNDRVGQAVQLWDTQSYHGPNLNELQSLDSKIEKSTSLCGGTETTAGSGSACGRATSSSKILVSFLRRKLGALGWTLLKNLSFTLGTNSVALYIYYMP